MRLVSLVETISSKSNHGFSSLLILFLKPFFKLPHYVFILFSLVYFLFSFLFLLNSFETKKNYLTLSWITDKAYIASYPYGFNSHNHYVIAVVSKKPKHHWHTLWFENTYFYVQFSHWLNIWRRYRGWESLFHDFVNVFRLSFCVQV